MRRDGALVILGIAAVLAFLRRRVEWGTGWWWPVPDMLAHDGARYEAQVSSEPGQIRPSGDVHRGHDILYRRRSRADRPEYKVGTVAGTPWYFAPKGTPILAAKDGVIWSAGPTERGLAVVIDHGKPFATFYQHLERLAVEPHKGGRSTRTGKVTPVKAGQVIGYMGRDPIGPKIRHLHFEVWHGGTSAHAVDAMDAMRSWHRSGEYFVPDPTVTT